MHAPRADDTGDRPMSMSTDETRDSGAAEDLPEHLRRTVDPGTFAYGPYGIPEELLAACLPPGRKRAILRDWERQLKVLGTTKAVLFSLDVRSARGELD
jgi:hypothetical protein